MVSTIEDIMTDIFTVLTTMLRTITPIITHTGTSPRPGATLRTITLRPIT